VSNRGEAHLELNAFRRKHDCALVISGDSLEVKHLKYSIYSTQSCMIIQDGFSHTGNISLCVSHQVCLRYYEHEFVELACQCPAVVCCRCSPTQKAQIVRLLQQHTANRTCAIGQCSPLLFLVC